MIAEMPDRLSSRVLVVNSVTNGPRSLRRHNAEFLIGKQRAIYLGRSSDGQDQIALTLDPLNVTNAETAAAGYEDSGAGSPWRLIERARNPKKGTVTDEKIVCGINGLKYRRVRRISSPPLPPMKPGR
jgi:hypothetical protein